eukprot:TRINITY_DN7502_c1_g1_i1.p1 TRINITY_DN7502_c1_g1~~TRINITY_DN7502_c1_g1_i1.p1  ORF type:complete len:204 (-),score=35.66 TRINITY_DN7502_c1_g1_i1:235-846(-)
MEAANHFKELDVLLQRLRPGSSTPAILLQPRLNFVGSIRRKLQETADEPNAQERFSSSASLDEAKQLKSNEAKLLDLLKDLGKELQAEPWFNPPSQRKVLKLERHLEDLLEETSRLIRSVCRRDQGSYKTLRVVNLLDPEDVRASGLHSGEVRREEDRLPASESITKIVHAASGCTSGQNFAEVFGPKAHCAATMNRILYSMS